MESKEEKAGAPEQELEDGEIMSPPAPALENRLSGEFKGSLYSKLESFGVEAYLATDVQENVLSRIKASPSIVQSENAQQQQNEQQDGEEEGRGEPQSLVQDVGTSVAAPVVTNRRKRKRIPKRALVGKVKKLANRALHQSQQEEHQQQNEEKTRQKQRGATNTRVQKVVDAMRANLHESKFDGNSQSAGQAGKVQRTASSSSSSSSSSLSRRRRLQQKTKERVSSSSTPLAETSRHVKKQRGEPQQITCSVCQFVLPPTAKICVMCGSRTSLLTASMPPGKRDVVAKEEEEEEEEEEEAGNKGGHHEGLGNDYDRKKLQIESTRRKKAQERKDAGGTTTKANAAAPLDTRSAREGGGHGGGRQLVVKKEERYDVDDDYDDDDDGGDPAWNPVDSNDDDDDDEIMDDNDLGVEREAIELLEDREMQQRQKKKKKKNREGGEPPEQKKRIKKKSRKKKSRSPSPGRKRAIRNMPTVHDDADDEAFQARYERVLEKAQQDEENGTDDAEDVEIQGGLVIPGRIWDKLLGYQQSGLCWMWERFNQNAGGIVADEMGLGKTIQTIAFFAGLHFTAIRRAAGLAPEPSSSSSSSSSSIRQLNEGAMRPSLIVCPASMLVPWLRELRVWHPERRVMLLHDSGNHAATKEEILEKAARGGDGFTSGSIVITTYAMARTMHEVMIRINWGVMVLDEGHRIRNPNAEVAKAVKKFRAMQKIVLSGTPIQNSLVELWSLFDFVNPGLLGTLPVFEEEFVLPIQIGGYKNASVLAVQTAHRATLALRNLIAPYILRRTKATVARHLPQKTEHVLFCNLARDQLEAYREFVQGPDCYKAISNKNRSCLFKALHVLMKLCNHPDLLLLVPSDPKNPSSKKFLPPEFKEDYGNPERSGKMRVLRELLTQWKAQGHKYLIFSQTRQVLDIIENMVRKQLRLRYSRIDGSTPVRERTPLIDRFNTDPSIDCMLLTTRAAGIGVSLTAANRVVLYDPHWNPSNDNQAKERSYRIGQKRDVRVYRLITRGTIEEKVYQRQIHKEFLTSKVLADPKQKRFFSRGDLTDLFVVPPLPEEEEGSQKKGKTETAKIFASTAGGIAVASNATRQGIREEKQPQRRTKRRRKLGGAQVVVTPVSAAATDEATSSAADYNDAEDLAALLGGAGWAHSALSHDNIINASSSSSSRQSKMWRMKAEERVKRSMERLAESGASSAPLNSEDLKARIRDRQNQEREVVEEGAVDGCRFVAYGGDFRRNQDDFEDRLFLQLRSFLRCYRATGVSTERIIQRFDQSIETKAEKKIFKKVLKSLADCQDGMWTLKKTTMLRTATRKLKRHP